ENGGPVPLGSLQISGRGLDPNFFPAALPTVLECDLDTAFRGGGNTPSVPTHVSYPCVSMRIRPSGAFIHSQPCLHIPSLSLVRMAFSVYPDMAAKRGIVTYRTIIVLQKFSPAWGL